MIAAKPYVFNHNLVTVPSLYLTIRPGARYFHSLRLLQRAKELDRTMFTKSGIMAGLGREANEVSNSWTTFARRMWISYDRQYLQPTESMPPSTASSSLPSSRATRA